MCVCVWGGGVEYRLSPVHGVRWLIEGVCVWGGGVLSIGCHLYMG